MYRKIISRHCIKTTKQPFFVASRPVAYERRYNCFMQLTEEHMKIKATMRSFERMLNGMNRTAHTVSREATKDIKNYIKFITQYQFIHREKEEYVYSIYEPKQEPCCVHRIAQETVRAEHEDVGFDFSAPGTMMPIGSKVMNGIYDVLSADVKIDVSHDIIGKALYFIRKSIEHMDEEDIDTYPDIEGKLNPNEIKKIVKYFAECTANKAEIIFFCERLAVELQQKH